MSLQLTPAQVEIVKSYRSEWASEQNTIVAAKEQQKAIFEALIDKLGIDKKANPDAVKSIKQGFSLYYKENAKEVAGIVEDAVVVSEL
jgi:hypothetical protein